MESQSHTIEGAGSIDVARGIPADLDALDSGMAGVHEALGELEQRIAPLLRPADGAEKGLASLQGGPPSDISQRLRGTAGSVYEARNRVVALIERLDL